jgi:hypothetical protein
MPEDDKVIELISRVRSADSEAEREEACREVMALTEKEFSKLFFPSDKTLWETCASLLQRIGFPRLNGFIPSCLEWYQDLNWPGIGEITDLMRQADPSLALINLENATRLAMTDHDEQWLGGLKYLMEKIKLDPARFRDATLAQALVQNDFY